MKKIVIEGKEYLEVPEDLRKRKLLIIRLGEGLYVVGTDEQVRSLIKQQVSYLASRRGRKVEERERPRVIKAPEKRKEAPRDAGYWVFDTEVEAAAFSRKHADEFQRGDIVGIRGFDGKFYAVRRRLYNYYLPRILEKLRESPMTAEELASALGKNKDMVKAVLELAREEGLIIEKSGGVYEYAG
ncbi:MAG: hypothetical protein GXO00_00795 [Candidatus Diapherotrites archaeon]|nr:hypothetical protein [Candidatus Diapherotrites archaeon]